MRKEKEKKKKINVVYSGLYRHCQLTVRTPSDWNAARSCQKLRARPDLEKGASSTSHVIQAEHFVGNPAVSKPLE